MNTTNNNLPPDNNDDDEVDLDLSTLSDATMDMIMELISQFVNEEGELDEKGLKKLQEMGVILESTENDPNSSEFIDRLISEINNMTDSEFIEYVGDDTLTREEFIDMFTVEGATSVVSMKINPEFVKAHDDLMAKVNAPFTNSLN